MSYKLLPLVLTGVFSLAIFPTSGFSEGIDLSLTARAEAGLDPATRDFIRNLPEDWRPQISAIIDDAWDRADKSVDRYIEQLDLFLTTKLIETQCAVLATEKGVVDDLVRRLPWSKASGPLAKLRKDVADTVAGFKPDQSPQFVMDTYADLILATGIISCQGVAVPIIRRETDKLSRTFSHAWFAWNRAGSFECQTVETCTAAYYLEVQNFIKGADIRDKQASHATSNFASIRLPRKGFFRRVRYSAFEETVLSLYQVENGIGAARAEREATSIQIFNEANEVLLSAIKSIDSASAKAKRLYELNKGSMFPFSFCFAMDMYLKESPMKEPIELRSAYSRFDDAIAFSTIVEEPSKAAQAEVLRQLIRVDHNSYCKK